MNRRIIRSDECDTNDEVAKLFQQVFDDMAILNAKICQMESAKPVKKPENGVSKVINKVKGALAIILLLCCVMPCFGAWDINYDNVSNPENLYRLLQDRFDNQTAYSYLFTPTDTVPKVAEGKVYYNDTANTLKLYTGSSWVDLALSTGNSLDVAYGLGYGITVSGSAVTLTTPDTSNNRVLEIVQNETTNNNEAVLITNTGTGDSLQFTSSGTNDIVGTSDTWAITAAGAATLVGATIGAGDITLENSDKIDNGTNDTYLFTTGDEDLKLDLTTGANLLTLSSSTGLTTIDFAALTSIIGLTTITGDAADFTLSITADAAGEDLIINQAGAVDASIQLLSAGTATDSIDIESTSGGISIAGTDDISIVCAGEGAASDILITQSGAADTSITLTSSGTGADAIGLITSAGGIDVTVAGAAAGEDLDLTANTSINMIASEAAADDAVVISAAGAGSGIQITSLADIDITTTGAAGEDISVTNTGGSIILTATESAVDSIVLSSSVGGIDITAAGGAATEDIDILATSSSVNIDAGENAAAAITITTGAGATGGTSETIVVTNTDGTGTGAITLASAAGGITATALDDISLGLTSSTAGEDILLTTTGAFDNSITLTSSGTLDDAIGLVTTAGGINIAMSGGAAGEDFEITTATSIDFSSSEAAADQFKMDATGIIAGYAINFETTDGGILLNADGVSNGDISIDAADDLTLTAAGDLTLAVTGTVSAGGKAITNRIVPFEEVTAGTNVLTAAESGLVSCVVYTGTHTTTLPQAAAGLVFTVIDGSGTAADDVIVDIQAGDNIAGDTNGDGLICTDDVIGSSITLVAVSATRWIVISSTGTWTAQ